jgi:hypothetical protein
MPAKNTTAIELGKEWGTLFTVHDRVSVSITVTMLWYENSGAEYVFQELNGTTWTDIAGLSGTLTLTKLVTPVIEYEDGKKAVDIKKKEETLPYPVDIVVASTRKTVRCQARSAKKTSVEFELMV